MFWSTFACLSETHCGQIRSQEWAGPWFGPQNTDYERIVMNEITATAHRALQSLVDDYLRAGRRLGGFARHRVEQEICYADHLKAIVKLVDDPRQAMAG